MITIFHNPECGTSRNVLMLLKASGNDLNIVEYLQAGWTKGQLSQLLSDAGLSPREALRTSKSPASDLGLLDDDVTDETIFSAMLEHPILVNRPLVVTPKGTKLCRPSEAVLDLLDAPLQGPLFKEDGELLIDEHGQPMSG